MKKLITFLVFTIFITSGIFAQSYIGMHYNDFFDNMLSIQKSDGNDVVGVPSNEYYSDGSYNITIKFINTMISCLSFDKDNICIQIYQFIPLDDRKLRKEFKKLMDEKFSMSYVEENGVWVEKRRNGVVVEHVVENTEIGGFKGIIVKSYMSYLK
jgi:hypothetical protein